MTKKSSAILYWFEWLSRLDGYFTWLYWSENVKISSFCHALFYIHFYPLSGNTNLLILLFLMHILTEWYFTIEFQVQYKINKEGKSWDDYIVKYSMTLLLTNHLL